MKELVTTPSPGCLSWSANYQRNSHNSFYILKQSPAVWLRRNLAGVSELVEEDIVQSLYTRHAFLPKMQSPFAEKAVILTRFFANMNISH
jgi:hypothetical protein